MEVVLSLWSGCAGLVCALLLRARHEDAKSMPALFGHVAAKRTLGRCRLIIRREVSAEELTWKLDHGRRRNDVVDTAGVCRRLERAKTCTLKRKTRVPSFARFFLPLIRGQAIGSLLDRGAEYRDTTSSLSLSNIISRRFFARCYFEILVNRDTGAGASGKDRFRVSWTILDGSRKSRSWQNCARRYGQMAWRKFDKQ